MFSCLISLSSIALCELRREETEIKIVPLAVFGIWAFPHPLQKGLKAIIDAFVYKPHLTLK